MCAKSNTIAMHIYSSAVGQKRETKIGHFLRAKLDTTVNQNQNITVI